MLENIVTGVSLSATIADGTEVVSFSPLWWSVCIAVGLGTIGVIILANWILFKKAGQPGWVAVLPLYNIAITLKIAKKPLWWLPILLFVPPLSLVLWFFVCRGLARVFNQGIWSAVGIFVLPMIFLPLLASESNSYDSSVPEPAPLSDVTKWVLIAVAVGYVLFISTLITLNVAFNAITFMDVSELREKDVPSYVSVPLRDEVGNISEYVRFDNELFYQDTLIEGAYVESFEIVKDTYAKDAFAVYFEGEKISGADPDTFRFVPNADGDLTPYTKDDDYVYYEGERLEAIDVATAKFLYNYYVRDAYSIWYIGWGFDEDDQRWRYKEFPVPADLATFEHLPNEHSYGYDSRDKDHYFYRGEIYYRD